jgi:polar amino acid transport system permease protein
MNLNLETLQYTVSTLGQGMGMTCAIFFLTLVISLPLGFLVCFGRMSKSKVLRGIMKFYIDIMRGTPLMLQLMIVYFAPSLVFGIRISMGYRFPAVIIAFAINYAAYFAEIYRGGIESIPVGQYEAAQLLGFNKVQTFMRIVLPQVIKRVLPSVTNEIVVLVKDTSLAYAIAVTEMFTIAKQVASQQASMLPYAVAFVFYFIFNWIVAKGMEWVEKKFSYYSN